ncbi:MAG: DNA-binding beta-propeller fold protein YncE [Pirellulaceae bacterium]|jgi:DNA-binding beta-propeller fold protein YncE
MQTVGTGDLVYEPATNWHQLPDDVQLVEAIGVAVDSKDNVFVFNRGEPAIIVFDRDGHFLNAWGEGQFVRPHGIWIAPDDTLYLTDDIGHSVRQFSGQGELLRTIGPLGIPSDTGVDDFDFRTIARGGEPFHLPTNATTTSSGDIFVADGYGNARVHHFSKAGELVNSWGQPGDQAGQFNVPHGIAVDRLNRLFVADRENSRIQLFTLEGEFIEQWTDVVRPCAIFIGSDDLVYVAELGSRNGLFPWMERQPNAIGSRVSIFDLAGNCLSRWGGGDDAMLPGEFYAAHDIWVDSRGDIYVGEVAITAANLAGSDPTNSPTLRKFSRC